MLIGTLPFAIDEHEQPFDFHRYTSFCLKRMFEESGFTILNIDYIGDLVGVASVTSSAVFSIIPKALHKAHLTPLAWGGQVITRLPELVYYAAIQVGINPGAIKYFRAYPLGFAFHVVKD